jgi:hypothetical protein
MAKKDEGGDEAAQARADEQARQAKIRSGTERIDQIFANNFTDKSFDDREQAYLDYALPQVDAQYEDAVKGLTFNLARKGMLDSSTRAEQSADLSTKNADVRRQVGNTALDTASSARADVESARAELIKMLNATGDVEGATNSALTRAQLLTKQPAYSPIGQLFAQGTDALAAQAAQEKAAAASGGAYIPRYNTGLFGASSSVKVS